MRYAGTTLGVLLFITVGWAADWPQWLGPNRDGISSEKVAPWQGPLKVLWRQPVGEGHSSPVVADGRVFLHHKWKDKDIEAVSAFDAATGKELWQTPYPRGSYKGPFGNGPRATPTVAGGGVYTLGITGVLSCFNAQTGKLVWSSNTLKEFAGQNLFFGTSTSPLVEDDTVLVNVGAKGASVIAFAKDTGKVLWKAGDDRASYSSPIAFGVKERQAVFLTQKGLVALRPQSGAELWRFPFEDKLSESSTTPVRVGELLVASSVTLGSIGLKLTGGEKPTVTQVWKNPELTCYFSTPVPVGKDQLYLVTGMATLTAPQSSLRCIDVHSGKELWKKTGVGKYHAALMRTGDSKLLMLEEAGNLVLIEPDPKEYRELARSKICGETWAHPALANGRLYVRDAKELICIQVGN